MSMRTQHARALLLFALMLIGPLVCANGGVGSTGVPTPTAVVFTPATVTIATYSTTVASPEEGDHHITVTASCRPGEQLLSGGYVASNVFESALFLDAVFPLEPHELDGAGQLNLALSAGDAGLLFASLPVFGLAPGQGE